MPSALADGLCSQGESTLILSCMAILSAREAGYTLVLIRLRGRLAGVFAGLARRLFQKDGTNQFQQGEHAAHQHCGLAGKVLLGRLSLEFAFQTIKFFANRCGVNASHASGVPGYRGTGV